MDVQTNGENGVGYSATEARDKNRNEYNETADVYTVWGETSLLMQ